MMITDDHNNNN